MYEINSIQTNSNSKITTVYGYLYSSSMYFIEYILCYSKCIGHMIDTSNCQLCSDVYNITCLAAGIFTRNYVQLYML